MNASATKVYKTSIVPDNSFLHPVRNHDAIATSLQIEVFHVLCFVGVFASIFAGIWKTAVAIDKREKAAQTATDSLSATSN